MLNKPNQNKSNLTELNLTKPNYKPNMKKKKIALFFL